MWNRACPLCFARVPRSLVLTRGDELVCPSCRTPLEISRPSRVVGALGGLIAADIAGHEVFFLSSMGSRWVLPMAAAILAYGIGSAIVLFVLADLVVQPKPAAEHSLQPH